MRNLHQSNTETLAEFNARTKKDAQFADKVALILLVLIVGSSASWFLIDALDKAFK